MPFEVLAAPASSILSSTTGFIAEAGFTHSLTPARNCTFACTYCYVPTMRIYGGLKPEDWRHWGQFTTFKSNAPELLRRQLVSAVGRTPSSAPNPLVRLSKALQTEADEGVGRGPGAPPHIRTHSANLGRSQVIYCSPLVDPYQPAEETAQLMPRILDELLAKPPKVFVIQTRGPLILRDLSRLLDLSRRTMLRVSFSITTNRDGVRKLYEPHCPTIERRLNTIRQLRRAGITTFATLAPILQCDPEELAAMALEATDQDVIGDALHVRSVKPRGATTREAAHAISHKHGLSEWLDPEFQNAVVERIGCTVRRAGRRFATGTEGFGWLAQ